MKEIVIGFYLVVLPVYIYCCVPSAILGCLVYLIFGEKDSCSEDYKSDLILFRVCIYILMSGVIVFALEALRIYGFDGILYYFGDVAEWFSYFR